MCWHNLGPSGSQFYRTSEEYSHAQPLLEMMSTKSRLRHPVNEAHINRSSSLGVSLEIYEMGGGEPLLGGVNEHE